VTAVDTRMDAAGSRQDEDALGRVAGGTTASATSHARPTRDDRPGTLAERPTAAHVSRAARDGEYDAPLLAVPAARQTVRGDLREIARDYVHSWDLLKQLVLRDIKVRYKQAMFGFAWAILMPTVVVLAGLAVRYAIAYAAHIPLNGHQIASMAIKSVPWAFFVGCLSAGTPVLMGNMSLVTKVYFPREVLPVAAVLAQTVDSSIGAAVITLILPLMGVHASVQLLWVPVLILCLWTFAVACALFLSCANLFFRDVKYLVQVFLTFGIFITPVLMDASMFGPKGARLIMLNPVAPMLEGLRIAVIEQHNLLQPYIAPTKGFVVWHPWYLAYSACWALLGLAGATILFHRSERRFAETI